MQLFYVWFLAIEISKQTIIQYLPSPSIKPQHLKELSLNFQPTFLQLFHFSQELGNLNYAANTNEFRKFHKIFSKIIHSTIPVNLIKIRQIQQIRNLFKKFNKFASLRYLSELFQKNLCFIWYRKNNWDIQKIKIKRQKENIRVIFFATWKFCQSLSEFRKVSFSIKMFAIWVIFE